eukprot:TRINITY_DN54536_c0_g1_i1.p1 TRINITY_DN54536_c0_g1~~TRINITY_DN54536_c0_g1_i1.p1  ORF type:complete len:715 (-),score=108.32 TRINITY_DN54536_c0_g1_i1:117-2261(-)
MLPGLGVAKVTDDRPNPASYQLLPTSPKDEWQQAPPAGTANGPGVGRPSPQVYAPQQIAPQQPGVAITAVPSGGGEPPPEARRSICAVFCEKWQLGRFTVVPEDNPVMDAWDLVVITALFATAVVLPFEVALLTSHPPAVVYTIGKCIDYIFTLDILITFNVAFTVKDNNRSTMDMYEKRPLFIARQYMAVPFSDNLAAGWFWPDVITVIPWESLPVVRNMSSLRLIRVLRLVRMLRLVRVIKLFKRWQTHSGVSYSFVKILTCACTTLLLVHWLACFWAHLGLNPLDAETTTWLSNHLTEGMDIQERPRLEIYNHALYFCTVVLTTVGFGDIVPTNNVEVVIMILTIFLTGITWAWVVANVVNVITNMDVFGTHFNQIMDDMNALMTTTGCTKSLKLRIRRHIHESYNVQRRRHHHDAIKWLSAGLQGELAIQSGVDKAIECIWYFRDLPNNVIIELADEFKGELFSPNEIIMERHSVSVIMRGSCIKRGKMFSRDAVIGEDVILASEWLRDTSCPRTLTFLEVMSIHRDSLRDAAAKYPDFDRKLRKAQLKLALWRSFVQQAWERKKKTQALTKGQSAPRSAWDSQYFQTGDGGDGVAERQKAVSSGFGWAESMDRHSAAHDKDGAIMNEVEALRLAQTRSSKQLEDLQLSLGERSRELEGRVSTMERHLQTLSGGMQEVLKQLNKTRVEMDRIQKDAANSSKSSATRKFFG